MVKCVGIRQSKTVARVGEERPLGRPWTVGAGTEWVISGPWTAKLEYLYVDLGNVGNTFTLAGVPVLTTSSHVTDNIVRIGLNYRFGGPVIARY